MSRHLANGRSMVVLTAAVPTLVPAVAGHFGAAIFGGLSWGIGAFVMWAYMTDRGVASWLIQR